MAAASQFSIKKNYSIAEGITNTAPIAFNTLTGTITSTTNAKIFSASGFTSAEIGRIRQDDTFLVEENNQLMVVASYDAFNNTIIFQNEYSGSAFAGDAAQWTAGPRQPGYPREFSVKGPLYKVDDVTFSSVLSGLYNNMKKRVIKVECLTGEVTVSDLIQSPSSEGSSGGSGALVDVFEPDTVVLGGDGVGYIQDSRMANKPQLPYFMEITFDGVPTNIYSATPADNELEYNADETLGRFDAINTFEIVADVTILVKIYLISA